MSRYDEVQRNGDFKTVVLSRRQLLCMGTIPTPSRLLIGLAVKFQAFSNAKTNFSNRKCFGDFNMDHFFFFKYGKHNRGRLTRLSLG